MKYLLKFLLFPVLAIGALCLLMSLSSKVKEPKMKYLPEDMVLIHGKEPFYISTHLTTNKEYMTYLLWLNNVYVDYPNVVYASLPDSSKWKTDQFNEPYVQSYLFHPAFEEYPVLGVSWIQADRFCRWKTDRLNEYILVKEKYFSKYNIGTNENNFNTEAWMCGQYDGDLGFNLKFPFYPMRSGIIYPNVRQFIISDSTYNLQYQQTNRYLTGDSVLIYNSAKSFLFPHFRLPTESELSLFYESQMPDKRVSSSFVGWYFNNALYGKMPNSYLEDINNIDTVFIEYFREQRKTNRVYPVTQFEWAFDAFSAKKNVDPLMSLYKETKQRQGGFFVSGFYPEFWEKDSLGRMQSFYILKNDANGYAVPVENYNPNGVYLKRVIRSKAIRAEAEEQYGYGNIGFRVAMCAD